MTKKDNFIKAIKEIFFKTKKDLDVMEVCSILGKEYKLYSAHETVRKHMKQLVIDGIFYEEYEKASRANNIKIIYCLK